MAVINRTPDSFYDQGATYEFSAALAAADRAVADGADILDIGGVRAGPGEDVSVAEEIRRVAGLVAAVRDRHPGTVISVDTWRSEVGKAVAAAGADLLNDAWGRLRRAGGGQGVAGGRGMTGVRGSGRPRT
jgi:dihydropteroate synthase